MNNRGQTVMLSILFGIALFVMGLIIMNFLKLDVSTARTALSCTDSANISDGTKLTCLIVDGVVPYFILLVISVAGGIIMERLLI